MAIRAFGRTEYGQRADPVQWHARCWCDAEARLVPFARGYLRCAACDTLVCASRPVTSTSRVVDDASDFYGAQYWTRFQTESLGHPAIQERARDDLSERCIYWLRALLEYRCPPGRLLEIGAAHGGFLRLAKLAGFDAVGLEMSPSVVRFARRTFDVEMQLGPLEAAGISDGAFDVVAAFDVLEHYDDPLAALREIRRVVHPDGLVMLQTPRYPASDARELLAANDPFLEHLSELEHVYLFSQRAVVDILARTGFSNVIFMPPIFGYDMFLVAGSQPLVRNSAEHVARALLSRPDGRFALALVDLFTRLEQFTSVAAERLAVIDGLNQACVERLALIESLDRELKQRP